MSPQLNLPKGKGVTVDNSGPGYPPKFTTKVKETPLIDKPASSQGDKNPYSNYFKNKKATQKKKDNGNVKRRVLKKGWIEET